jgi:GNAT superfamily N-acetyltransferase
MLNFVSGNGDVINGREKEIAQLFVSSMPDSVLAKLGLEVAILYFQEVSSLSSARITLALDNSQRVVGYLDVLDTNIFNQILKKKPIFIAVNLVRAVMSRKIDFSQLLLSDKAQKTVYEHKINSLPELSYIFIDPLYQGKGIGKNLLIYMSNQFGGFEFYTKTLESNKHVVKMYESSCTHVDAKFFYKDKVNRYIIIFVEL